MRSNFNITTAKRPRLRQEVDSPSRSLVPYFDWKTTVNSIGAESSSAVVFSVFRPQNEREFEKRKIFHAVVFFIFRSQNDRKSD